jgi:hypothetical protein
MTSLRYFVKQGLESFLLARNPAAAKLAQEACGPGPRVCRQSLAEILLDFVV